MKRITSLRETSKIGSGGRKGRWEGKRERKCGKKQGARKSFPKKSIQN